MLRRVGLVFCTAGLAWAPTATAADGVSASVGEGARDNVLDAYRGALQWVWARQWLANDLFRVVGYWDVSVASFEADDDAHRDHEGADRAFAIAAAPVWRIQLKQLGIAAPFAELAIGAAWLSETELATSGSAPRELGSSFQFEDRIAVGASFGRRGQLEISAQRFHYSNLGLGGENDGIDAHLLMIAWRF